MHSLFSNMESSYLLCLALVLCAVCLHSASAAAVPHLPIKDTRWTIHNRLTSRHAGVDFAANVQSLIDRVLLRAGVQFTFQPVLEIIDYAVVDGQPMDVFEIEGVDGKVVLR